VIPDNGYPTNNNTFTLQHCLNFTKEYFASNVQLHFLPGQYFLDTDLRISGIKNFALVGNISDEEVHTVINCTSPASVVVERSENILISNIILWDCYNDNIIKYNVVRDTDKYPGAYRFGDVSLLIIHCNSVEIVHFKSLLTFHTDACSIQLKDNIGYSLLYHITSNCLFIDYYNHYYLANSEEITIFIIKYTQRMASVVRYSINILCDSNINKYDLRVGIFKTQFYKLEAILVLCSSNCEIITHIVNCTFANIKGIEPRHIRTARQERSMSRITCDDDNFGGRVVMVYNSLRLLFKDTSFLQITGVQSVIDVDNTKLYFEGSMIFRNIQSTCCIITAHNSHFIVRNHTTVLNNTVYTLMNITEIYLEEESVLNFTLNNGEQLFSLAKDEPYVTIFKGNVFIETLVSPCLFQYVSTDRNLDSYSLQTSEMLKYSIIFNNNFAEKFSEVKYRTTHCSWSLSSAFQTAPPNYINRKIIHYYQNNFKLEDRKEICLCNNGSAICQQDELDPIYPGQTITLKFMHPKQDFIGYFRIDDRPDNACRGPNKPVVGHIDDLSCTKMEYTVLHNDGGQCELYVIFQSSSYVYQSIKLNYVVYPDNFISSHTSLSFDMFYIPLRPCPKGFSLSMSGYCQCDSILLHFIPMHITCDINDGTIPHPGDRDIS